MATHPFYRYWRNRLKVLYHTKNACKQWECQQQQAQELSPGNLYGIGMMMRSIGWPCRLEYEGINDASKYMSGM